VRRTTAGAVARLPAMSACNLVAGMILTAEAWRAMGKYIDGIFNYCDRWCERCPFTSRCRNFSMGRAIERHVKRRDEENEAFWDAMDKACGDSLKDVSEQAESLAPEESEEEKQEKAAFGREMDEQEQEVRAHPLARLAEAYLWTAHRWLERRRGRVPEPIADAIEVIAWYHIFISMKVTRALHGLIEQEDEDYEELTDDDGVPFPKDSEGSAKIAVIAIERSFGAWSILRERVEKEAKNSAKMMATLLRLRSMAEEYFPDARTFHRPGFDDVGSRD
jgi:hypothetical protein